MERRTKYVNLSIETYQFVKRLSKWRLQGASVSYRRTHRDAPSSEHSEHYRGASPSSRERDEHLKKKASTHNTRKDRACLITRKAARLQNHQVFLERRVTTETFSQTKNRPLNRRGRGAGGITSYFVTSVIHLSKRSACRKFPAFATTCTSLSLGKYLFCSWATRKLDLLSMFADQRNK